MCCIHWQCSLRSLKLFTTLYIGTFFLLQRDDVDSPSSRPEQRDARVSIEYISVNNRMLGTGLVVRENPINFRST